MIQELGQLYIGLDQSLSRKYETNVVDPDIFVLLLLAQTFLLVLTLREATLILKGEENVQNFAPLRWDNDLLK